MRNFKITVNGVAYDVTVEETDGTAAETAAPVKLAAKPAPAKKAAPAGAQGSVAIKAPMPGTIVKMNVNAGDKVSKGTILCVFEAMKMENEILAPQDGTIVTVVKKKGDSVVTDEVIFTLD